MVNESEVVGDCLGSVRGCVGLGRWMITGDADVYQAVEIRKQRDEREVRCRDTYRLEAALPVVHGLALNDHRLWDRHECLHQESVEMNRHQWQAET